MRMFYQTLAAAVLLAVPAQAKIVVASVYGNGDGSGPYVATGARFHPEAMTCAHKTLPFGSKWIVRLGRNYAVVTVNDRGPWIPGREIDLTPGVAKAIHFSGLGHVRFEPFPMLPKPRPENIQ